MELLCHGKSKFCLCECNACLIVRIQSFRKLKSKIFRAVTLTWQERDELIETLLSSVNENRRGLLKDGRGEVRGYSDMADEELQAWRIFASELG